MSTFYCYGRTKLHLCNKLLVCTDEKYEKLKEKEKITESMVKMVMELQKYGALTLYMIHLVTGQAEELLETELNALMEYGIVIKQFYECVVDDETVKTETFYCVAPWIPKELVSEKRRKDFKWTNELRISDAMAVLSFNQFHLALKKNVPGKALQAQLGFSVRDVVVDCRYKLKGRCFLNGYSHMIAISVRDCGEHNKGIVKKVEAVFDSYSFGKEKMPWIVLLCQGKSQCAYIDKQLKSHDKTKGVKVYYLLDTDIEYDENPLHVLQTYRYEKENKVIVSDTFKVENWF